VKQHIWGTWLLLQTAFVLYPLFYRDKTLVVNAYHYGREDMFIAQARSEWRLAMGKAIWNRYW
jgi:hypothetical protein